MSSNRYSSIADGIDGKLNKELLNKKRDRTISIKDIDDSFEIMQMKIANNSLGWIDIFHFIYETLRELQAQGCDMRELFNHFRIKTKELLSNYGTER